MTFLTTVGSYYSSVIFCLIRNGADPDLENDKGESFRKMAQGKRGLEMCLWD